MLRLRFEFTPTEATNLQRVERLLANTDTLNAEVEVAAVKVVRDHMHRYHATRPNRLGAPSTGYWRGAIEGTTATRDAGGVEVEVKQRGIRMKYYGGVIRPSGRPSPVTGRPIQHLTIPMHPGAHGKTVMDLGGRDAFYHVAGKLFRRGRTGKAKRQRSTDPLYYILKKSVRIKPDPTVLPPHPIVRDACELALRNYLTSDH